VSADPSSELPTRTGSFRAVVRVGDTVVEYSRTGSGRPVVVLGLPSRSSLRPALAQHFRLVAPESGPSGDFATWLRCFLDGLGLSEVDLIGYEKLARPALDFALMEPDRIKRLVLLPSAEEFERSLEAQAGLNQMASRTLLEPGFSESMVDRVVQFLLSPEPA
jgi:hypothetical protein